MEKNKYINTKTVVIITNEKELDIFLNKVEKYLKFTQLSGRNEDDARRNLNSGDYIYMSLLGSTIEGRGKENPINLNFTVGGSFYKDNGYKIITFKEFLSSFVNSRYVRQLNFESFMNEAYEPGQEPKLDYDMRKIKQYGMYILTPPSKGNHTRLFNGLRKLDVHIRGSENEPIEYEGKRDLVVNYEGEGFKIASYGFTEGTQVKIENVDDYLEIIKNNTQIKEAFEPGQHITKEITKYSKIIIKIENETQSKQIQKFFFKNNIFWGDGDDKYYDLTKVIDNKVYPSYISLNNERIYITTLNSNILKSISFEEFKNTYME